jgi:hypothetical protein
MLALTHTINHSALSPPLISYNWTLQVDGQEFVLPQLHQHSPNQNPVRNNGVRGPLSEAIVDTIEGVFMPRFGVVASKENLNTCSKSAWGRGTGTHFKNLPSVSLSHSSTLGGRPLVFFLSLMKYSSTLSEPKWKSILDFAIRGSMVRAHYRPPPFSDKVSLRFA